MKTLYILTAIGVSILIGLPNLMAQEFKVDVSNAKKIQISDLFGKIDIKEISGNQLVISVKNLEDIETPEKAKGLKPISANGEDNTKIGLNVNNMGSSLSIKGTNKKTLDGEYLIQVPKGLAVSIDYNSPFTYGDIDIVGMSSEIEVNTLNDDINLKDVTGPLVLHSINGNINVVFISVNQDSPISITAINGEIDLSIPSITKANLNMNTMHGEVYTNFDIVFDKKEEEGLSYIGGGHDMEGTINNGGVEITLKSINDNIYLRKK